MKTRLLGTLPAYHRMDDMDLQIRFEAWVQRFPHIKELYDRKRLTIKFDKDENVTVETVMSDKHWMLWLLRYPNTPAGNWINTK